MVLALGQIDFGATDANAEFVMARKADSNPVFLDAYVVPPLSDLEGFRKGRRFVLLGLKGTGKTAVLRELQKDATSNGRTVEFLIFRNEILEEKDLLEFSWPVLIDDDKVKQTRHYLHCIKRILLAIILKHCADAASADLAELSDDESSFFKRLFSSIRESSVGRLVQISFDTIQAAFDALKIDPSKLTGGSVGLSVTRLLKRQNDLLLDNTCRLLKKSGKPVSIFVDEIHFAFRDEATLRQDTMLVRDTILAVINLNERFIAEGVDCTIYAGLRSEFVDHPLIAAAEINNALSSYGETLSWATFPANSNHPMFDIAAKRVERSIRGPFPKQKIVDSYFGSINPQAFVEATWSKPRDIIRFFNVAKRMYPTRISLKRAEFNAVLREYSIESWLELKTATTAFLPSSGIVRLEEVLRELGPKSFQSGYDLGYKEFVEMLNPVYAEIPKEASAAYTQDHLVQLLYILGLFYTTSRDNTRQYIVYAYHRGNRYPAKDGIVHLHRSIARAFS